MMMLSDSQPSFRCFKCNVKFTVTNPSYIPIELRFYKEPTCPDCGATMTLRKPKPGQTWQPFYGCSNYPRCKGQKNGSDQSS